MAMTDLLLKSSGPVADQYKVLAGDQVVGHIRLSEAAPAATPWRWTLSYGHHKGGRTPTHCYGATCEAAVQAFAKSWRRESQSEERSLGIAPRASPRAASPAARSPTRFANAAGTTPGLLQRKAARATFRNDGRGS